MQNLWKMVEQIQNKLIIAKPGITVEQHGNLHHWDVHIDVLGEQIANAKRGLTWKERWANIDREIIDKNQQKG